MKKPLTFLYKSRVVRFLQCIALIFYLVLIWFSIGVVPPQGVNSKLFAQNNIATLIIWGVWLPFLLVSVAFLGRIWCALCPLELIGRIGSWLGYKFIKGKMVLPKIFNTGIAGVLIYAALLFMVLSWRFPTVPANVATLLVFLLICSFILSFLFGSRAFCNIFCPASILLRVSGRRGMLRIRQESAKICKDCKLKNCVALDACPSKLNPKKLSDSSLCTLCGDCVESCAGINIIPYIRKMPAVPFDSWRDYGWPVTVFAFFITGYCVDEIFHNWEAAKSYYMFLPSFLKQFFDTKLIQGAIIGTWAMVVVPGVIWFSFILFKRLLKIGDNNKVFLHKLSLPVITILTAEQLTRAFTKFSHWIPSLNNAWRDFLSRINDNTLPQFELSITFPAFFKDVEKTNLFSSEVILIYSIVVVSIFSYFSLKEAKKLCVGRNAYMRIVAGFAFACGVLILYPKLKAVFW